ncbi:NAD(P)-dependent oxidoreductase [Rhodoferax sp. TBRC 17198]|uniref:NAD-dependent epimerase/dehydratase family protein n=1 Tax=Rhodoferax potami TaxID=3068338 RepID=UPI0028BE0588|nr:NAD(P)-dependent oxidoreductase [Rhodoferax sp. TBRC 17198]MDT7524355.1 NAD(P)-dependent oxidoreductase [Rhodoferax sp. TBRC 17198]
MLSQAVSQDLQDQHFTVVGAAGFVGRRLCATLQARGAQVWAPARHGPWPWQLPQGHALGHVMYCAGLTADYLARPFDTVQAHVSHLAQVLQHGLAQGTLQSLVYLSSTRLYDGLGDVLGGGTANEGAILPIDPTNSRHLYDLSKGLGESLCYVAGQGLARVARLACVYEGPQDSDGFLPALLRQVLQARAAGVRRVQVSSSPHFTRDYVHLDDVVDALIRIAVQGQQPVYNVASGANVSNAALFEHLERRWGCAVQPLLDVQPVLPPVVNIARLRTELHWQPRPLLAALDEMLATEQGT